MSELRNGERANGSTPNVARLESGRGARPLTTTSTAAQRRSGAESSL
jgi:hypothetical protein